VERASAVVAIPERPGAEWRRGFLAGVFDACGRYTSGLLRIAHPNRASLLRVRDTLHEAGFATALEDRQRVARLRLRGGLAAHLRFFAWADPAVAAKRSPAGLALKLAGDRRVVAVFQPHLYSRTRDLAEEFARAFYDADVLVVTDVYPAREEPIEGVSGQMIADLARQYGHRDVHYVSQKGALPAHLQSLVCPGDLVVTMGAGDVYKFGEAFLKELQTAASDEVTER